MKHVLTTGALALAIAAGGITSPAQARDGRDVLGIIAGAAAVGLIAKSIKDSNDRKRQVASRNSGYQDTRRFGYLNAHGEFVEDPSYRHSGQNRRGRVHKRY